jgi:hypothetical protein
VKKDISSTYQELLQKIEDRSLPGQLRLAVEALSALQKLKVPLDDVASVRLLSLLSKLGRYHDCKTLVKHMQAKKLNLPQDLPRILLHAAVLDKSTGKYRK